MLFIKTSRDIGMVPPINALDMHFTIPTSGNIQIRKGMAMNVT